jgi:hypothetical protein
VFFSVTVGTETLSERVSLDFETTEWRGEFERPEEVVCFLEFRSNSGNFVNELFNVVDAVFTKCLGNNSVIRERKSVSVNLTISTFIDQTRDGVTSGITKSDVGFNPSDHVPSCFVKLNKDTIMKLSKSEEL